MGYSEHLDDICEAYLKVPVNVSEVFAELSDTQVMVLLEKCPDLKNALIDELRTWNGFQTKARNRAEHEAAVSVLTEGEDEAYDNSKDRGC